MKNTLSYILFILGLMVNTSVIACDICGCKLGGFQNGILPQYNSHNIGVRYNYADFKARIEYNSPYDENEYSNDTYHRMDFMGRYVINKKLQVNIIVPYMYNVMRGNTQNIDVSGIGDPVALFYYNPFNTGDKLGKGFKHSLLIGGGMKFPLGDFESVDNGEIANRNFQLGSGSLDYLLSANYTIRYRSYGLNLESSYKMNTRNKSGYIFGNQMNVSSYVFYHFNTSLVSLLPYTGLYYEQSDQHKEGKIIQTNTGGEAYFFTTGAQILRSNWTLSIQFQTPFKQVYNTDQISIISAGNRWTTGLIYNIPFKTEIEKMAGKLSSSSK